jgi:anti-sigma28 factor (negative regulator of flagellin synthesis)
LKAAIEGGSYKVDADKVADKLVDEHLFGGI